jgi:hypothetical protein
MQRISKRRCPGDEFDREGAKLAAALAFPWAAGEVARRGGLRAAWRGASKAGRGGLESGGTCARRVEVARRFGEGFLAAVGFAGKRNKGGELRRGVEGGRGASEE